jgi:hypothetical protein
MARHTRRWWIGLLGIALLLVAVAGLTLRAQHRPADAIDVAQAFARHVHEGDENRARQLGADPEKIAGQVARLRAWACTPARLEGWFPFQSNGNRVRRWLGGQVLDESPTHVEFVGRCAFRVSLTRSAAGPWRVVRVEVHAL